MVGAEAEIFKIYSSRLQENAFKEHLDRFLHLFIIRNWRYLEHELDLKTGTLTKNKTLIYNQHDKGCICHNLLSWMLNFFKIFSLWIELIKSTFSSELMKYNKYMTNIMEVLSKRLVILITLTTSYFSSMPNFAESVKAKRVETKYFFPHFKFKSFS